MDKAEIKQALKEAIKAVNEKWITIHPHGDVEDENGKKDYRRLKLKDDETPQEAIKRVYGKEEKKSYKEMTYEELQAEKEKLYQELIKKHGKWNNIPKEEMKKYMELDNLTRAKKKENGGNKTSQTEKKTPKESKPVEQEIKGDENIIKKLSEISAKREEIETKKWRYTWGTPERQKAEKEIEELDKKAKELSSKLSIMGDSWKNAKGATVTIDRFENGQFVLVTKAGEWAKSYDYQTDVNKIMEIKRADQNAYELAQKKQKEKEQRTSKKVVYKKGTMPKAKTKQEAEKLAREFNIADNINYGGLSVDICNAMNESANDILAEFPKIRELNKEYGSLQARNKSLLEEAFEIQGEALAIPIRTNLEKMKKRYGEEYFTKYYGNKEAVEKQITEKVKKILKDRIGIYRAGGEIAHCRYVPPEQAGIAWNEKYKDRENFDYTCGENGFHPQNSGSLKAIVDHEFGHQIDRFITLKGGTSSEPYKELTSFYKSLSKEEIKKGLSGYAATKFAEFIAEGFTEYKNNPKPRPIAVKIGTLLTKAYKEIENNV